MTPKLSNTKLGNNKWINVDVQARIYPPPITLLKAKTGKTDEEHIIKIKMRQDPASSTPKTNELKVQMFENGKPEEFLQMWKELKTGIDGTGTTSVSGNIQLLRTMLRR